MIRILYMCVALLSSVLFITKDFSSWENWKSLKNWMHLYYINVNCFLRKLFSHYATEHMGILKDTAHNFRIQFLLHIKCVVFLKQKTTTDEILRTFII